jgi:hypothetical protein
MKEGEKGRRSRSRPMKRRAHLWEVLKRESDAGESVQLAKVSHPTSSYLDKAQR